VWILSRLCSGNMLRDIVDRATAVITTTLAMGPDTTRVRKATA